MILAEKTLLSYSLGVTTAYLQKNGEPDLAEVILKAHNELSRLWNIEEKLQGGTSGQSKKD